MSPWKLKGESFLICLGGNYGNQEGMLKLAALGGCYSLSLSYRGHPRPFLNVHRRGFLSEVIKKRRVCR